MINPFTSTNQNYLFRKNYQYRARNSQAKDTQVSNNLSVDKLNILQANNPFKIQIPFARASPSHDSTSRALSASKVGLTNTRVGLTSNSQGRPFVAKKLFDDTWKREIQKAERQKLQYYGAQGLRYNAQTYSSTSNYKSTQKWKPKEYHYTSQSSNMNIYQQRNPVRRQQQRKKQQYQSYKQKERPAQPKRTTNDNLISSYHDYYVVESKFQKKSKRQAFQDDFQEDLINEIDRKKPKRQEKGGKIYLSADRSNEYEYNQEQSKLVDMFGSSYDERFKKEMKQNSVGSPIYDDRYRSSYDEKYRQSSKYNFFNSRAKNVLDMYDSGSRQRMRQSKNQNNDRRNIKRFHDESSVHHVIPDRIQVNNVIYYRIELR